ncbi:MAG: hypothetical protein IMZ59_02140 [Actinobacteria bacterium]|nr:hypothetical protein [Actinomycetota bacterium]
MAKGRKSVPRCVARSSVRTVKPKNTGQYTDVGKPVGAIPPVTSHPKPEEHKPKTPK